ncbi:hypothetical protein EVAR_51350_1 [Eumeta japonica]|uniref:Uncharacterized protein n=1 Tax=Eumeta variegata TaxID=151549 RepID=A0A4C1XX20_EUMVA|nr:hypothetical protein EVAR_51350_1 [Eumeta japonica]
MQRVHSERFRCTTHQVPINRSPLVSLTSGGCARGSPPPRRRAARVRDARHAGAARAERRTPRCDGPTSLMHSVGRSPQRARPPRPPRACRAPLRAERPARRLPYVEY